MTVSRRRLARPLLATAVLSSAVAAAVSAPPPGGPAIARAEQAAAPAVETGDDWYHSSIEGRGVAGMQSGQCYRCHSGGVSDPKERRRLGLGPEEEAWGLGNESTVWNEFDRHYHAYKVLLPPGRRSGFGSDEEGPEETEQGAQDRGKRVQEMAKRLGAVDKVTGESLLHLDARCLACHSSYPIDYFGREGLLTEREAKAGTLRVLPQDRLDSDHEAMQRILNLGVTCEGCHGPSNGTGEVAGWGAAHFSIAGGAGSKPWRLKTPSEKLEGHGYWPVGSWTEQTKICLSCHLGNVAQGKVVTHEMYAAGHPPLPGFELVNFGFQEPQHWRDLGEKSAKVRDEFVKGYTEANDGAAPPNGGFSADVPEPDDLRRTRKMLVAAAASASESLRFAADLADDAVACPAPVDKPGWPELTAFACYSCHHELSVPSWRQDRLLSGIARPRAGLGRPRLHEWPESLLDIAAEARDAVRPGREAGPPDGAYELLRRQPFGGDPRRFQAEARRSAAWADELARDLEAGTLPRDAAERALARIAAAARDGAADYDSARQLAWAFAVVYRELTAPSDKATGDGFWYDGDKFWYQTAADPAAKVIAEQLHTPLRLDLLGNIGKRDEETRIDPFDRPIDGPLNAVAGYDPETVRKAFEDLAEAIPPRPRDRRSAAR